MAKKAKQRRNRSTQREGDPLVPDFGLTRFLTLLSFSPKLQVEFQEDPSGTMRKWGVKSSAQKAIREHDAEGLRTKFSTQSGFRARGGRSKAKARKKR